MIIARTREELDSQVDRSKGIGFVPTMGALHEGHLSLMRAARQENELVVTSIFVNPTQFGPNEDFARYPRNEKRDSELAEEGGVDVLFFPTIEEMYPTFDTTVRVGGLTSKFEGLHRPGHFDGVATVVCKLFNIVRPRQAYFGQKDLQQVAVVRRMVLDLCMGLTIRVLPTVREPDGLALSSRNVYLTDEERVVAPNIYRALSALALELESKLDHGGVAQALEMARRELRESGIRLEYLELVDSHTFSELNLPKPGSSLIFAGYLGSTRLIDNVPVRH